MKRKISPKVPGSSLLEVIVASLLIAVATALFSGFLSGVLFPSVTVRKLELLMRLKVVNDSYGESLRVSYPHNILDLDYQSFRSNDGVVVKVFDRECAAPLVTLYQLKNGAATGTIFAY